MFSITKIYLFTLFIAFALCQTPENDITDLAASGKYLIVYCNATTTGSHVTYLQSLIPYMQSLLQAVLTDLDRGTSSPAYRAFFKTNNNLDAVRQVFTDMINGTSMLTVDTENNVMRLSPPTLVCADNDQAFLRHLMESCGTPPRNVMYVMQPAKIVAVCPIFWTLPRIVRRPACPRVARDGRLLTEPWKLRTTQFAVLVHELVHVYNRFDRREEVYNLMDLVDLSAEKSLENAQNFASYAAAVQAGCKEFPASRASHSGDDFCHGRCLGYKLNSTLEVG